MTYSKDSRHRQFPTKISTTSLVKLYILHLLKEKRYYGNEIITEIKRRLKNKWEPSPGMIYPLLRQLEDNGYILGHWQEPDKRSIRSYRITDEGLKHYNIILRQYEESLMDSLVIVQSVLEDIYNKNF